MMKKLSIWFILTLTLVIGFTSCDANEEFDNDPEVEIIVDNKEGSAVYSFEAKTSGMEDAQLIWTVDGNVIDGENQNEIINQVLDYLFESGAHTICVKLIKGDLVREACVDIDVTVDENNPCPDLFFRKEQYEEPYSYKFFADFEEIDSLSYGWFVNGDLVEDSGPDEKNYLIWDFEGPGRYEVCIKTETPDCPEGTSYCKVIEIEEGNEKCLDILFRSEEVIVDENTNVASYTFTPDFEGVENVTDFQWFINDEQMQSNGNDQSLSIRLELCDKYEVCLKVFTSDCPEGAKYCKTIDLSCEKDCPEISFEIVQEGSDFGYNFFPRAFEGIDESDTTLEWYADDTFLGKSGEFPHNNPFYTQLERGQYLIYLVVKTNSCPEGVKWRKLLQVGEPIISCPELSFELEQDGDNPAYYFYPGNFEGVEDVSSEWFINEEYVGSSMGMQDPFYYQFNPGTYEICLLIETPECPNGVKLCKEIVIPE